MREAQPRAMRRPRSRPSPTRATSNSSARCGAARAAASGRSSL